MERKKPQMNEGPPISVNPLQDEDGFLQSLLAHSCYPRKQEPCIAACVRLRIIGKAKSVAPDSGVHPPADSQG